MAYTNELSYLLEDDDKSIELVHAVFLVSPTLNILYYIYSIPKLLIASDVVPTLHVLTMYK